ncbi:MAG: hypothetical protein KF789_10900 [Bdellovibrionaceae bacterium]|nr:hypothetical protein [Pseudobdellovibrionaceae bacterium]
MRNKAFSLAPVSLLLGLIFSGPAWANFESDLGYLRSAFQLAGFDNSKLEPFLNPHHGASQFRLSAQDAPWAGNYFPMNKGGIANRWADPQANKGAKSKEQWNQLPDPNTLTQEQINRLSPAEKYDLWIGDKDFSVTNHELNYRGPRRATPVKGWEGFCNGVRCAGINLPEPTFPITVKNPNGIEITFQPADLKALAGASYFYVENYAQIGAPSAKGTAERQPNPAIFDLALRVYLAENKKAFVIDSNLGPEIWNESVIGYKRTVNRAIISSFWNRFKDPRIDSVVRVKVELETLGEISIEASNKPTKDSVAAGKLMKPTPLSYLLYLDKNGRAIDGVWEGSTKVRGVDFAWFGTGRGTDGDLAEGTRNPHLKFDKVRTLFLDASASLCSRVF